jgi:hypothetical protein
MTGGEGFKSFIEVMNEEGVRARATTYHDKHDEDWISRIQDNLVLPEQPDNFGIQTPKLRILSQCVGLINDIETVEWAKRRNSEDFKPTLEISRKDYLACLKYALATNLSWHRKNNTVYYRNSGAYGMDVNKRIKMKIRNVFRK